MLELTSRSKNASKKSMSKILNNNSNNPNNVNNHNKSYSNFMNNNSHNNNNNNNNNDPNTNNTNNILDTNFIFSGGSRNNTSHKRYLNTNKGFFNYKDTENRSENRKLIQLNNNSNNNNSNINLVTEEQPIMQDNLQSSNILNNNNTTKNKLNSNKSQTQICINLNTTALHSYKNANRLPSKIVSQINQKDMEELIAIPEVNDKRNRSASQNSNKSPNNKNLNTPNTRNDKNSNHNKSNKLKTVKILKKDYIDGFDFAEVSRRNINKIGTKKSKINSPMKMNTNHAEKRTHNSILKTKITLKEKAKLRQSALIPKNMMNKFNQNNNEFREFQKFQEFKTSSMMLHKRNNPLVNLINLENNININSESAINSSISNLNPITNENFSKIVNIHNHKHSNHRDSNTTHNNNISNSPNNNLNPNIHNNHNHNSNSHSNQTINNNPSKGSIKPVPKKTLMSKFFNIKNQKIKKSLKELTHFLIEKNVRHLHFFENVFDSMSDEEQILDFISPESYNIHPDNKFLHFFYAFVQLAILFSIIYFPWILAYEDIKSSFSGLLIELAIDFIFITEFIINCITGFHENDTINYNLQKILLRYFSTSIISDFVCAFPSCIIIIFMQLSNFDINSVQRYRDISIMIKLIRYIRTFQWMSIKKFQPTEDSDYHKNKNKINTKKIKNFNINSEKELFYTCIRRIVVLFILFYLITHIFACLWIYIGNTHRIDGVSWITKNNLLENSNDQIYIASFYFCLVTIFGIGYGDISPTNANERGFSLFFLVIACIVYAFFISSLSSLFQQFDTQDDHSKKMKIIKEYIDDFHIKDDLQLKLRREVYSSEQMTLDKRHKLFDSLPKHIRNELFLGMYQKKLEVVKCLKDKSYDLIRYIASLVEYRVMHKNDLMVCSGATMEEMLLVSHGELSVELDFRYNFYVIAKIHPFYHYGDVLMYSNDVSPFNIKVSTNKSEIFTLNKENLRMIKTYFPIEFELILEESLRWYHYIEERKEKAIEYFNVNKSFEGYKNKIEIYLDKKFRKEYMKVAKIEDDYYKNTNKHHLHHNRSHKNNVLSTGNKSRNGHTENYSNNNNNTHSKYFPESPEKKRTRHNSVQNHNSRHNHNNYNRNSHNNRRNSNNPNNPHNLYNPHNPNNNSYGRNSNYHVQHELKRYSTMNMRKVNKKLTVKEIIERQLNNKPKIRLYKNFLEKEHVFHYNSNTNIFKEIHTQSYLFSYRPIKRFTEDSSNQNLFERYKDSDEFIEQHIYNMNNNNNNNSGEFNNSVYSEWNYEPDDVNYIIDKKRSKDNKKGNIGGGNNNMNMNTNTNTNNINININMNKNKNMTTKTNKEPINIGSQIDNYDNNNNINLIKIEEVDKKPDDSFRKLKISTENNMNNNTNNNPTNNPTNTNNNDDSNKIIFSNISNSNIIHSIRNRFNDTSTNQENFIINISDQLNIHFIQTNNNFNHNKINIMNYNMNNLNNLNNMQYNISKSKKEAINSNISNKYNLTNKKILKNQIANRIDNFENYKPHLGMENYVQEVIDTNMNKIKTLKVAMKPKNNTAGVNKLYGNFNKSNKEVSSSNVGIVSKIFYGNNNNNSNISNSNNVHKRNTNVFASGTTNYLNMSNSNNPNNNQSNPNLSNNVSNFLLHSSVIPSVSKIPINIPNCNSNNSVKPEIMTTTNPNTKNK